MAACSSKKVTMMRRNDLRGDQAKIGAVWLIRSRMVWRLSAEKTSSELMLVKISVLEGGVGWLRAGRLVRSRLREEFFLEERPVEGREGEVGARSGDSWSCCSLCCCCWGSIVMVVVVIVIFWWLEVVDVIAARTWQVSASS